MLNEKQIRALYSKPPKKVIESIKPKAYPIPKEDNVNLVFAEIKLHKEVTRKVLMKETGVSQTCLNNVIIFLLKKEMLTKRFIGNAGANKIHAYSAKLI